MTNPDWCPPKECEILHCVQNTFCIGKIDMRHDVINGKIHKNDHVMCIKRTDGTVASFLINQEDMDLLAKLFLTVRSQTKQNWNLAWYFGLGHEFSIRDEEIFRILKVT